MRIDVHAHYFPSEYLELLSRLAGRDRETAHRLPGGRLPLDERLGLLDEVGIDVQVLSEGQRQPYLPRAADAVAAARLANDLYADACRTYRGRFAAFAAMPLPHIDAALAELERSLDTLGMVGVTLGCSVAGRWLDDPLFEPFWAELDRRGTVVFLHPVGAGVLEGDDPYGLTWMVGAPFEDTVAALRLVLSGLTARYPKVRIIVPHLGGTLPFLIERLRYSAEAQRAAGRSLPPADGLVDRLRRLWFDTVNTSPDALRCACGAFGTDRLLLGTDFPYLYGPRLRRCVTYIEEAGLGAAETAAILGGNAQALLGLQASAPS
ncbi:MAG TPA: amidohydrolase family protein [Chloroflexota bacterium]|nr:amidohydrolase family protein [Chloroflexota bacterium]